MSTGGTAFTTTHRVIYRVHHDTSVVRADAEPALAAGLSVALEVVISVGYLADGCTAGYEDHTDLA